MKQEVFGITKEGKEAHLYTISNEHGMKAVISDFGAVLIRLYVPDQNGDVQDVVLGYDQLADYESNPCFLGATIGPNANRIAGAKFPLDGTLYHLDPNEGPNNLHSHFTRGIHKRIWDAVQPSESTLELRLSMKDGELGFPGNMEFKVTYQITEDMELKLMYHGVADKKTIINPTNHTYFNLAGHDFGSIADHELKLYAHHFTPVKEGSIPTGEIAEVKGTPMDFTEFKKIGKEVDADFDQLRITGGYDHNYVVDHWDRSLKQIAAVREHRSGRTMEVYSDLPGVQFYGGNFITPMTGKASAKYDKRCAFCLETDYFPDAIHQENFPSPVFGPEQAYDSTTVYRFRIQ